MKRTYDMWYRGEHHTRQAYSLTQAVIMLAGDLLIEPSEIKTDFWRDVFPVKLLKWGIGITLLALGFLAAYLIFM